MDAHGRGEHVIHCFADQHGVTAIDLLKAFVQHSAPNQKPHKGATRKIQQLQLRKRDERADISGT